MIFSLNRSLIKNLVEVVILQRKNHSNDLLEYIKSEVHHLVNPREKYRFLYKTYLEQIRDYRKFNRDRKIFIWINDNFHFILANEPGLLESYYQLLRDCETELYFIQETLGFIDRQLDKLEKKYKLTKSKIFLLLLFRALNPFRRKFFSSDDLN